MHTVGIIAEYNPFHNGHQYHIEETRRKTGADYVIAVISGDFVQRGSPALLDKYTRTKMALTGGADLVLELPVTAALSSAEGFATGGVCLLEGLGVTDVLSFGSEAGCDSPLFSRIAALLTEEPEEYKKALSSCLKGGMSFPEAREAAIFSCLSPVSDSEAKQMILLLARPNNILGLEYQKALFRHNCRITPLRIDRLGSDYSNTELTESFSSATAIRHLLLKKAFSPEKEEALLQHQVPGTILSFLRSASREHRFLQENDFSDILCYALTEKREDLSSFGPANGTLAFRTMHSIEKFESWEQFVFLLKTKNQTYTAVNRYLAHIMLNLRRRDFELAAAYRYAPYARILGFRKSAAPLLKEIQSRSRIPLLMRLSGDSALLNTDCRRLLQLDLNASALYNRILFSKSGCQIQSDWRHPLTIL